MRGSLRRGTPSCCLLKRMTDSLGITSLPVPPLGCLLLSPLAGLPVCSRSCHTSLRL